MRRLTRVQWHNAVQDLLGVETRDIALPSDGRIGPFTGNAALPPSPLHIDQYQAAAELAATRAVRDGGLGKMCSAGGQETCVQQLLVTLAARAWRRPLTAADEQQLSNILAAARAGRDVPGALILGVQAVLEAPAFLYFIERGVSDQRGRRTLTGFELGARLAALLWDGLPDETLNQAARSNALLDDATLIEQSRRMLAAPGARAVLGRFHREWLAIDGIGQLEKDAQRYPFFNEAARAAYSEETTAFVDFVIRRGGGQLATLLSAPFSFPSAALFRVYGLTPPAGHDPALPVGLPPEQRAGILTQPAVMATHAHADITSPVHRGLFVLRNLLCRDLPPPPADVDTSPVRPDPAGAQSRRALFAQHEADPNCGSCHTIVDPLGFAFEHYDAVGAWRTMDVDEQRPVDARATIALDGPLGGPVDGALPLIAKLADDDDVRRCYVRQWYRFASGRPEGAADEPTILALGDDFGRAQGDIPRLIVSIIASPSFRTRDEVSP